jgi:hypothetical protein
MSRPEVLSMQKAFGILCIVVGIWVGMEVYQEGTARAFDGLFVRLGLADVPAAGDEEYSTPGERAGGRLAEAYQAGMDRGDRAEDGYEGRAGSAGERTAERARGMADR